MAEPGTDPAGCQAAPPPPPPPLQTETADTAGDHATTPPPPPQTETAGPGPVPTPPPQNQTAAQTAGQPQVQPQPRSQTGTGEVAGQPRTPRAPSQERASAADAEKQPPAPQPQPQQQQQQKDKGEGSKRRRDEAEASAASGRKEIPPKKPAHQTERRKSLQRTESVPQPPEGGVAGDALDKPPTEETPTDGVQLPRRSRLMEMFQKKGRFVKRLMSWYRRHRSPEKPVDKAAARKEKGEETKSPTSAQEEDESKSAEGKVEEIIKQPSIPAQGDKPPEEKQKDKGEGSKRRRDEAEASAASVPPKKPAHQTERRKSLQRTESVPQPPEGGVAGDALDKPPTEETPTDGVQLPRRSRLMEMFQKKGRIVKWLMSLYRRHRSPEKPVDKAAAQKEKGDKSPTSAQEKESKSEEGKKTAQGNKPHKKWALVEAELENILEETCTRLLAADFRGLDRSPLKRECLLTFSVFALDSKVKKQAVTYWWAAQFKLSVGKGDRVKGDSAEGVFKELSGDGFLEPMKNSCSGVIHGCRVNPLVHWMVKNKATAKDKRVDQYEHQPKSDVLCLTAGYRERLQKLRKDESKDRRNPGPKEAPTPTPQKKFCIERLQKLQAQVQRTKSKARREPDPKGAPTPTPPGQIQPAPTQEEEDDQRALLPMGWEGVRVILNVSAHVYRLPELLLNERLVVLQLGQWWISDNDTYMEVDGLQSLRAIGNLKNLRYLGLRGLSRLTELPTEIRRLQHLAILDVRGCQNLVKVASQAIATLKGLTHLDLTECYMLEHIDQGITSLSGLQVFKGFVFGVRQTRRSIACRRRMACRLQDLGKLTKLRKLSVNVTTDADVDNIDMAHLAHLADLRSLTVTWGELPSILVGDSPSPLNKTNNPRLKKLLDKWTGLELPATLEKLDVRCYPEDVLPEEWFNGHENLKKLYVRGGEVKELKIPKNNCIETLRLRYLKHFKMKWDALRSMLQKVKYVEVVIKDAKVMKIETRGKEDPHKVKEELAKKKKEPKEEELRLMADMKKRMAIPDSTLDENGVWVRDEKEEESDGKKGEGTQGGADNSNGKGTQDKSNKKGEGTQVQEPSEAAQAPSGKEPKEEAHKTEAASGAAEVSKASEEAGKGDEPPTEEGGGDAPEVPGEVKKVDGGDAEGEGGQGGRPRVSEKADEEPTGEDGVDDDTSPADATRSPAAPQLPELPRRPDVPDNSSPSVSDLKEDASAKVVQANASASGTQPPPVPPATSSPAPAAADEATAKPKEPGKADDDDGSTVTRSSIAA